MARTELVNDMKLNAAQPGHAQESTYRRIKTEAWKRGEILWSIAGSLGLTTCEVKAQVDYELSR